MYKGLSMPPITVSEFVKALKEVGQHGKQSLFLNEHYHAEGRAMTASMLAAKVNYKNHGGINLWYGKLAGEIERYLGRRREGISVLVDLLKPPTVTNKEWILVMRPEFADALKQSGWIELSPAVGRRRAQVKRGDARSDPRQPATSR